jgi:hypothetical protein
MRTVRQSFVRLRFALFIAGLAPLAAWPAQARQPAVESADSLAPGQFTWQPDAARDGAVEIVVSLPLQRLYVYRGGTLIGVSTVSSGRDGYATPVGSFNILQKNRVHHSNLYSDAPMPFMQRLTWDGVAIHGGELPGYPASHGCIRVPMAFARHLFAATEPGVMVYVTDAAPARPEMALAMARSGVAYTGMGGPEEEVSSSE